MTLKQAFLSVFELKNGFVFCFISSFPQNHLSYMGHRCHENEEFELHNFTVPFLFKIL